MTRLDNCRSCKAPVVWLTIRPGGRRMPIDPDPVDDGNIMADLNAAVGVVMSAETVAVLREDDSDEPLYRSHFATCPDARTWRRT